MPITTTCASPPRTGESASGCCAASVRWAFRFSPSAKPNSSSKTMSALPRSLTDKIRTDNRLTELCDVFKVLERGSLNLVFGSVYAVYSPSGKVYIGQTTQSMKARKRGHVFCANSPNSHGYNTKFSRAVRKYDSSLVWKILHRAVPEYALVALEKLEIKRHQSVKKGYNSIWSGSRTTTVWTTIIF